jgi:hypothetical protein
VSAGTAAAVLSRQTHPANVALVNVAVDTFNNLVGRQQSDGSWDESPVETGFLAVELGTSYLELKDLLSPGTRQAWANAMSGAANYIVSSDSLLWYINGNVNLRQAEVMWLTWQITGEQQYENDYEAEWNFTMSPPQARWPGFGLRLTRVGLRPDGGDSAGYLAESGGGAPGFDPEYTMTQLDTATGMWILSHDPRWLRLMNLFFNQLRSRISSDFWLNATGGSRHSTVIPFYSAGPIVLYASGDRPDLARFVTGDLRAQQSWWANTSMSRNVNSYRGLSGWLSLMVLTVQKPNGLVPAAGINGTVASRLEHQQGSAARARRHAGRDRSRRRHRRARHRVHRRVGLA